LSLICPKHSFIVCYEGENMKKVIIVVLTVSLICFSLSCTSEQIKKVGTAAVGIIPKVLATVTHAFGGAYTSLIDEFFIAATESKNYKDEAKRLQAKANYPEVEHPKDQSEYSQDDTGESTDSDYQDDTEEFTDSDYQSEKNNQEQPQEKYDQDQKQTENISQQDSDSKGESLQVNIDLIKEEFKDGRYIAEPIVDGQTLTQRDNYKVLFQSQTSCYMYIAQLDSTGKMDPIFPSRFSQWKNPVQANKLYDIPAQKIWFYLDANVGVETIYFIASRTRRQDIESVFGELEMKNQTLVQQNQVSMKYAYLITRGVGGVRPGNIQSVSFQNGSQGQFESTLFETINADLVITRWFHHR
jgi:hypothetical protein